jgi:CHAD domain-containing protein
VSVHHERAVPTLHERLHETRREANRYRELAELLAKALDGEVDARIGALGTDVKAVRAHTAYCLRLARSEGVL